MKTMTATVNVLGVWGPSYGPPTGVLLILSLAIILVGCGGGAVTSGHSFTPPPPIAVKVSVSPSVASVDHGGKYLFEASVTGSPNHAVTWSIQEGAAGGSIDQNGLYTAPLGDFAAHVVATSVADSSKSSSASVTPNPISVSISATTAVPRGRQRQLTAYVFGTVVQDLTWSIDEGAAGGSISSTGLYTAPMSGGPFHVTALSVADPAKAATTAVLLTDAGFRLLGSATLQARIFHTATLLPDGKVLIAGGSPCDTIGCSPWDALSTAELFDPATETFSPTGSMSAARVGHTASLLDDGKVLVVGGSDSLISAELYDPVAGTFSPVGNGGAARTQHTASRLSDGRVLVAGGYVLGNDGFGGMGWVLTNTAQVYDPTTQSFSSAGDMPVPVAEQAATVLLDGTIWTAGGTDATCPGVQTGTAIFHPDTNAFVPSAALADPRGLHTVTTLNDGHVLITGGIYDFCIWETPSWDVAYDTAVVFDPATSTYSSDKVMRERRWGHTATLRTDGTVLVVGVTADLFDPATGDFVVTGDPNVPNLDNMRRATRLSDGRVLFTGGNAFAEIYE